jgi:hypothetical protein
MKEGVSPASQYVASVPGSVCFVDGEVGHSHSIGLTTSPLFLGFQVLTYEACSRNQQGTNKGPHMHELLVYLLLISIRVDFKFI